MTLRELAESLSKNERWALSAGRGTFTLVIPLSGGRTQKVTLREFAHEDAPMVRFTSSVGSSKSLDGERCRTALELNGRFPTGCLAIDEEALIMTDTRPLKTTTPESSARAVRFIAGQADTYERHIYGTDTH